MAELREFLGGGSFGYDSTSGAAQTIRFDENKVHVANVAGGVVNFTFSVPAEQSLVELILDVGAQAYYDPLGCFVKTANRSSGMQKRGLSFSSDGMRMFTLSTNGDVTQYNLSSPYDLSSATYAINRNFNAQDSDMQGMTFSADGTKLYLVGQSTDKLYKYDVSPAWDLTNVTNAPSGTLNLNMGTVYGSEVRFNADGSTVYILDYSGWLAEYDLPNAHASFGGATLTRRVELSVDSGRTVNYGLAFSDDMTRMFVATSNRYLDVWDLAAPGDTSTLNYLGSVTIPSADMSAPRGVVFDPSGRNLYMCGQNSGDAVQEYVVALAPTLVFPQGVELPEFSLSAETKAAMTILNTGTGSRYTVTKVEELIT